MPKPSQHTTTNRAFAALAGVVVLVLVLVAVSRFAGIKADVDVALTTQDRASFTFKDAPSGAVLVVNAQTGALVRELEPGTNGFVRATLRGLARKRKAVGIGPDVPFQIIQYTTGHVALVDPATGTHVALNAFGPTNVLAFSRLLKELKS